MNIESFEDQLQRELEALENNKRVEAQNASNSAEERDLLHLAQALRLEEIDLPDPAVTAAQRAAVVERTAALAAPVAWLDNLRSRFTFTPQQLWIGAAAAAFVLLIGIVVFQSQSDSNDQRVDVPPANAVSGVEEPTGNDGPDPVAVASETERVVAESQTEAFPADGSGATPAEPAAETIFLPFTATALVASPERGTVHDVRGRVEKQTADGGWEPVTNGAAVTSGDVLRTGTLSRARVRFYDGSEAALDAHSEVAFEVIDAQRPESGFRTIVMHQTRGRSWHDVDDRGDSGSRYEVKTPTASGIARGTRFVVTVNDQEQADSHYEVTEGRVDVSGGGQTVAVAAGQQSVVTADGPPTAPVFSIAGRGTVTAIADDEWTIAGQVFRVTAETIIVGAPEIGDNVIVSGHLATNGQRIAERLEKCAQQIMPVTNQFTLIGTVEAQGEESWTVQGQTVVISGTVFGDDDIDLGDTVQVSGQVAEDGALIALEIVLVREALGFPFSFAGLVGTIDPWVVSGVSLAVTTTTDIEDGIVLGDAAQVSGFIDSDGVWQATKIILLAEAQGIFTITGELTGIEPWSVDTLAFSVDAGIRLAAGLAVGDVVFVRGRVLSDGTWLAESVERVDTALLEIVFAGTIDQIDPWIVSGLPLTIDEGSRIDAGLVVGDLVRVTARINGDGRWIVVEIELLSREALGANCVTLTAIVTNLNNGTVVLSDGTSVSLADLEIEGELQVGAVVVIVACVDEEGLITIEHIIVLYIPPVLPPVIGPPAGSGGGGESGGGSVTVCHKPGTPAEKTKTLPSSALNGHLGHGDTLGACP